MLIWGYTYGLQFAWQVQFQPVQPRVAVLMQFEFREETAFVSMVPCVHLARVYVLSSANDEKIFTVFRNFIVGAKCARPMGFFPLPDGNVTATDQSDFQPFHARCFFPRRFHFPSVLWELMFRNRHTYTQCVRAF